jgi:hypothetical protein
MGFTTEYTTYENTHNPHVTIHFDNCKQLKKHGGVQNYNQGCYKNYPTFSQAHTYVLTTKLPLILCSFCNPK